MTPDTQLLIGETTQIFLGRRQVVRDGRSNRLTALEARLLSYLWLHRDRPVPVGELHVEVWGYAPGTVTRAVDSTIRRLRHKVEDVPSMPVHLLAIGDDAYRLVGVRSEVPANEGIQPAPSTEVLDASSLSDERDPLTGLLCRSALLQHLSAWLNQGASGDTWVLICSLDRLRHINSVLGLAAGDALLARAGHRLREAVRPHRVGRFTGNAFVIVARGFAQSAEVLELAEQLLREFEAPFELEERWTHIGLDIGIASADGAHDAERLIRQATQALETAERTGPGRVVFFDRALAEQSEDDAELEAALAQAIEEEQLSLHYQPIFELRSGKLRAFEALLRWRRPGFGLMRPDRFIAVAEQSSLITRLQQWVIPRALAELGSFRRSEDGDLPDIWINVSGFTLSRPDIAPSMASWLAAAEVPANRVTLELTETGLLRDEAAAKVTLSALRKLGVRLAIDDFGTGYASMSHLVKFPLNTLKIDKSFVDPLGEIDERTSVAATIVDIGRHFGLEVVAEGVERPSQLAALGRLGCDLVQGHLLAEPASVDELGELISRNLPPGFTSAH